jgi:hypothetical protein
MSVRPGQVRIVGCLMAVGLAVLLAGDSGKTPIHAEPLESLETEPPMPPPAGEQPNIVRQGFPAAKFNPADLTKSETAWEIEWDLTHPNNQPMYPPGSVFRIRSAKFMWKDRAGKPQWVTVARMLELAEIYVPYDNGNTAFLDIHDMSFHITQAKKEFLGPNCVAPGEILKSSNPYWSNTVHKEVHDDGIRWMSAETNARWEIADRARRGEKMVLWATYYGANYRYLIEYGFSDDGMLSCRIGPTGRNIFSRQETLGDTHLHIGCWRLEFDLGDPVSGVGGPKDNDILLARRVFDEAGDKFTQVAKPFNRNGQGQACEGSARWTPEDFTVVRAQSRLRKNAHGKPIAFDLIPHRYGAMRQLQSEGGTYSTNMDFINYDFWVTRTEPTNTSYIDVPQYASQRRPLSGYPTTVWHCTPALHSPRGEDFWTEDGVTSYGGVALTVWTGFYLKPRDLFDGTPLYQPTSMPRFR